MRPTLEFLQTQCLVCVFVGLCMPGTVGSLPHALPWHVYCPARCVCQIKPWFSADSVYHEAPTVDCNDLLLTQLPLPIPQDTHTLRLQSNLLSELDTVVLQALPNLTELDLSQNRFDRIRAVTENSSLPSLLSLHLEENHLSHLPDSSFSSLPTLQELFLSHNNLHSIAPGAFAGMDSLLRLHINNNRLTTVDPLWFKALPRLEVLMLGGNPVEALPERGFAALKSLRSLVLGGMGLKGIAEKALEGLEGLESLSFYDNRLEKVPNQALKSVPGLKFLDLNKNRIKLIETGDFRDMVHLKELGLNNIEELVSIERAALENLPELTKLEITNNPQLSYIHPKAFVQLSRLESLMLNSNSLSALHKHVMLSLPSLQEVSLHSNPLRCDCLFHWAAEEASHPHGEDTQTDRQTPRMVRFIQPQATLCSEPPELRARRVREVSSREMSALCLPMIPTSTLPSYVGVREGGKLVLHCRALADPPPKLYWVTPSGIRLGPTLTHSSKGLVAAAPCHNKTASREVNLPSTPSISVSQPQGDTPCDPSKHYRLLPEGTLEINKVTLGEAGLYTCVAENALGADTRSVTVGVRGREKKRRRGMAVNRKGYPLFRADASLEVREIRQHYAILSWQSGRNRHSTRLSWQAINSKTHTPTYTTRILAGTQSFNLTHLQAETFYRVCLHLGTREGTKHASRRSRESRKPQCVSFRTTVVQEPRSSLQLGQELTSTAVTLLLIALILLLLAGQGWETEPGERSAKAHLLLRGMEKNKAPGNNQKTRESNEHQQNKSEKLLLHQDCRLF